MTNLPESPFVDPTGAGPSSSRGGPHPIPVDFHSASVDQLILFLQHPQYRENALLLLNKKRESHKEMALSLWNSFNTVYILLQEVLAVYKLLSPSKLTTKESNRVCNALALLQCIAAHPVTKMAFIEAKIPVYLYPFLNTRENERPLQYLRLTSLGVIGALVKVDDSNGPQVIHFLLETELFPLCLRCMELGDELTQTVTTFIVSKILMQEEGLHYCCNYAERCYAVGRVLGGMIEKVAENPSQRLLRHIIRCYLKMSEIPRACDALKRCIPAKLKDAAFINILQEDAATMEMLGNLFYNVTTRHGSRP